MSARLAKFLAFQACFVAVFIICYLYGWIELIFNEDRTKLTVLIFGVFIVGLITSFIKAYSGTSPLILRRFARHLVKLGLVGTIIGFVIALYGVDPSSASQVSAVPTMVAELLSGMKVALYTTLVGLTGNIWLTVNYELLEDVRV